MPCNHGKGFRLDVPSVNLEQFDDDGEATRVGLLNDFLGPGQFGRMFGDADKFRPADAGLDELGAVMQRPRCRRARRGDAAHPRRASRTWASSSITTSPATRPRASRRSTTSPTIEQARSPSLDLDSLYGMGPVDQHELYDPAFPPAPRALPHRPDERDPDAGHAGRSRRDTRRRRRRSSRTTCRAAANLKAADRRHAQRREPHRRRRRTSRS